VWLIRFLNFSVLCFKLLDILCQCAHQSLGVLWGEDDARFDFGFCYVGHHTDEVQYKLRGRMCNDGQVSVYSFCDCFWNFDVKLVFWWWGIVIFVVSHNGNFVIFMQYRHILEVVQILRVCEKVGWWLVVS